MEIEQSSKKASRSRRSQYVNQAWYVIRPSQLCLESSSESCIVANVSDERSNVMAATLVGDVQPNTPHVSIRINLSRIRKFDAYLQ
jgi:hypothetical protein